MNAAPPLRLASREGSWVVAATVLGSGAVFVESTVVNVALPAMGRDLALGVTGLQWLVNSYLLTLSALLLLGGSLGDVLGQKRVFEIGLGGFAVATLLCAVAPDFRVLVVARLLQGVAGALLVPTSLAHLDTAFAEDDRAEAIGLWAGWSAISTAVGPLVGGLLIDLTSWRWVFAAVVPLPLVALAISRRRGGGSEEPSGGDSLDLVGAVLVTAGLAGVVWSLLELPERGPSTAVLAVGAAGIVCSVLFLRVEAASDDPLLPLRLFRAAQFAGANATTLLVYAALGILLFFLMIQLQSVMGYSALAAGASLLPINLLMLVLSPRAGRWGEAVGARVPIAGGALVAAAGMALLSRIGPESGYVTVILPGIVLFGSGLGLLVAPLTGAALAAADEGRTGIASGVNNATARLAGLLATALVPLVVGVAGLDDFTGAAFDEGFGRAMWIAAGLSAAGALVAWTTIRRVGAPAPGPHPAPTHGCAARRAADRAA